MNTDENAQEEQSNGNAVFGPKTTLYAGLFLLGLTALVIARHYYLDIPFGFDESAISTRSLDTIQLDTLQR